MNMTRPMFACAPHIRASREVRRNAVTGIAEYAASRAEPRRKGFI